MINPKDVNAYIKEASDAFDNCKEYQTVIVDLKTNLQNNGNYTLGQHLEKLLKESFMIGYASAKTRDLKDGLSSAPQMKKDNWN